MLSLRHLVVLVSTASLAFAQVPTFSIADTTSLNATLGNAGKGVLDPQARGFVGVAYGNNLFVAVVSSTSENVVRWATSPDGVTWTARSQATPTGFTTAQMSKVHYQNGKFVFFTGFGDSATVSGTTWCYFSEDGLTWTANKVTDGRINVEEFDTNGTLTVAAAHNGSQMASSDLVTWVSRPVLTTGGFDYNDVAYGAGRFFSSINGFGGTAYASTDAVTWTQVTALNAVGGPRMEAGNGFVLVTLGGSQYKTTDGTNFTKLTLTGTANWLYPGGSPRFTGGSFVALGTSLTTFRGGYMISADGQSWTAVGMVPDAPKAETGFIVRAQNPFDIAYGAGKYVIVGQDVQQAAFSIVTNPYVMTLTASSTPPQATTLAATNVAAGATVQWQRNGNTVTGATSSSLSLAEVLPADSGVYTAAITAGGTTSTQSFIVGASTTSKVIGTGTELSANVPHPNGNTFDQILPNGAAVTITADANQATRTSFIDLNNDIVQVEFSGAGSLSIVFDGASGPAAPTNYNQPTVSYMKGHAGIVVTGANETTNLLIFCVGRATAFDITGGYNILFAPSATNVPANNGSPLFTGRASTVYDGVADIAFIAISSTNGKFGGIRSSNTSYFATKGITGIYAPGVQFTGPIYVGDIDSRDNAATPMFVIGSCTDTRITGGDLLQASGQAVRVSGLGQLRFTAGVDANGNALSAKANRGVLRDKDSNADVTLQTVVNP